MTTRHKSIITAMLCGLILLMLLPWFGGMRGVQEIRGIVLLTNPFVILFMVLAVLGTWMNKPIIGNNGIAGILIMEAFHFLFWYLRTIDPDFSLQFSFQMAYPEFYLGFLWTLAIWITALIFTAKDKKKAQP